MNVGGIEPLKRGDLCCKPERPLKTTQSLPIHTKCNCCPELDFVHHSSKDFKNGMSRDGMLCEGDNLKIKNDGRISRTDEIASTALNTVSHKSDDTVKSLNFKDHRRRCFKEVILQENIPTVKVGAKIALEEHSNVLDDQTCSAARIRAYQRKSIRTKDEIDDLSPELRCRKLGGPKREKRHFLSLDTECPERKKVCPPQTKSFARFPRAFFIFVRFADVRSFHLMKCPFFQLCGRREHMMTKFQFCLLISEALVPI